MEALTLLEKKINDLLEISKKLKAENVKLLEENKSLYAKIDELETSVLKGQEGVDQDKELTKLVLDGLIKDIDSLVEGEQQQ